MKRLISSILVILLLIGCSNTESNKPGKVIELTTDELINKFENKDNFVFFVAQTTCKHCEVYLDVLDNYVKNHPLTIYFVEADKPGNDSFNKAWNNYFPDVEETPTTLIINKGEIVEMKVGELEVDELEKFLDENGVKLPN